MPKRNTHAHTHTHTHTQVPRGYCRCLVGRRAGWQNWTGQTGWLAGWLLVVVAGSAWKVGFSPPPLLLLALAWSGSSSVSLQNVWRGLGGSRVRPWRALAKSGPAGSGRTCLPSRGGSRWRVSGGYWSCRCCCRCCEIVGRQVVQILTSRKGVSGGMRTRLSRM